MENCFQHSVVKIEKPLLELFKMSLRALQSFDILDFLYFSQYKFLHSFANI